MLRPHAAQDGALLRIRIPGGRIGAAALRALSQASTEYADGDVGLTSRANLQLRAVATTADDTVATGLVDALATAGLLPHPTHDRVRSIACSPLTGLIDGHADLRPLIDELDAALCAAPELAALPGPFRFGLDDGRGDIGVDADLSAQALDGTHARIWVGGLSGPRVPLPEVVPTLIELAHRFVRQCATGRPAWHVRELPRGGAELLAGSEVTPAARPGPGAPAPLGALAQADGRATVSVLAPLGRLTPAQAGALADAANGGELVVTPWRGVLVPDLDPAAAAVVIDTLIAVGLVADGGSPWRGVTACAGAPRCARGTGDTEALARQVVAASTRSVSAGPVHVAGCARSCGRPSVAHTLAVIDRRRVHIQGPADPADDQPLDHAAAAVAATRAGASR